MHKHASANRFYRLVWSHVNACWVAVAEGSRSHGKGAARRRAATVLAGSLALAGAAAAAPPPPSSALPNGMQLVAGKAGVAVQGSSMTVSQATQQAILNWQGFNIGSAAQVRFDQPNASAVALNRVVGGEASAIYGKLSSNGKVFLVNPQGVLFGAGAQVDVGGLVASSLGLSDQAFLSGSYEFSGGGAGAVRNEGSIRAAGGVVALLAPAVSNSGVIAAQGGSVALAAGNAVGLDFRGDGLITVRVEQGALNALAENKGLVQADGGQVLLTARAADAVARSTVNNSGVVQARGLVAEGGTIRLVGDGNVQAGSLDVSSAAGQGGSIEVSGGFVSLDGALQASGARGGAITASASGDLSAAATSSAAGTAGQGGSITLKSGAALVANAGAATDASGATDGGRVSLQAGGSLLSSGKHAARGAAGTGGRVDLSGADVRLLSAQVDASGASQGGLVRVGGAFQGGATRADAPDQERFTGRWNETAAIANAERTFVNDSSVLDVSARGAAGQGGTAIVWSDRQTTMLGTLKASGAAAGGAVEISGKDELRHVGLENLDIGAGGRLLLDPKNITIGSYPNVWTYEAVLGKGYSGGKNASVAGLAEGDAFGYSVALTSDGTGLAVGAPFDKGAAGTGDARGAVRLFTFGGSQYQNATLRGTIGSGYTGGGNLNVALQDGDQFGSAVALDALGGNLAVGALGTDGGRGAAYLFSFGSNFSSPQNYATISTSFTGLSNAYAFGSAVALNGAGTSLAVGALYDTGASNNCSNCGAVYLFNGIASTPTLANIIGSGYGNNPGVASDMQFGTALALNQAGDRLAVGAIGADNGKGKVFLFTNPFSSDTLAGTIGSGGSLLNVSLNDSELFGSALAFNANATRLAVGAPGNGGFGSAGTGPGSVRVIDFSNTSYGGASLSATLGRDFTVGANADLTLNDYDNFGFALAMNGAGDRLVVGLPFTNSADDSTVASGGVHAFSLLPAPLVSDIPFDNTKPKPGLDVTVDAAKLAATLASGVSVTLQANNDLTLSAGNAVSSSGAGSLTLQAGRSVLLNSSMDLGSGNLTVLANAGTAAGVVNAHRDSGSAVITTAAGTTIDGSAVSMTIGTGANQTNKASGDIMINGTVRGDTVLLLNSGPTADSDVIITSGGRVIADGSGASLRIAAAGALGGTFINGRGATGLSAVFGSYHVFTNTPTATTEGMTGYNKHYNQAYTSNIPGYASSGNWFYYTHAPTLTITAQNASKVYDGTTGLPVLGFGTSGFIDGDSVANLTGALGVAGMSKNAGSYAIGQGTLASTQGYTINYAGATLTVSKKLLTVGASGLDKVYDGGLAASVNLLDDRVAGDVLSLGSATRAFATKQVGASKAVTVSGITVGGTDAGNYTLASTTAATTASITPRTLTASATASDKIYDATTGAVVALGDDRVAGDALTLNHGAAAFADKNVGAGKSVSVTGISLSGADAGNYVLASTGATGSADITARSLTVTATAANKVYDGSTAASATLDDNRIAGDVLTVSGSAAFADKNAGTAKTVTASGLSISGTDAGNYTLSATTAATTADIGKRALAATATGSSKVYDGTTGATVTYGDDRVAGDTLSVSGTAAYSDKNAGAGKAVNVSGMSLSGADAGNYTLAGTTAATTGDITQRTLNVSTNGGVKTYDGTTSAVVTLADDRVAGDSLNVSGGSASFADKNAGTGKAVSVSGITVGGTDAGNYALASTTATGTADIAARALAVSATGVNRVYDGGTSATVTFGDDRIAGDALDISGSASFADKHAANGKSVSVSGIALAGADAGNYTLGATTASTTANITQRTLTATAAGANKVYDATTGATVTLGDDRVGGDTLTLNHGAAAFSDKNVGAGKAVSVSGISLSGADAGNYVLASTSAAASADITARALTVSAAGVNKVYDGGIAASVTYSDNRVAGDVLDVSGSAAFADKNAGTAKTVTASGLSISGTDAGNYTLSASTAATTADIGKRTLAVTASAATRAYDGTTSATATFGDDRIGGDQLTLTGNTAYADKHAGANKAVTVTGISLSGTDAGNYTLASTSASGTGTITKRALTAVVAAQDKVYDGTTSTSVTLVGDDRIAGDQLTVSAGNGRFADKNAGVNKAVTLDSVSLGGADARNYTLSTNAASSATITARALQVGVSGNDKVYDGTTAATVSFTDNRLAGDSLTVGGQAAFADKNVGSGKAVSVNAISLSGADAGNYFVGNGGASTTASIAPKALAAVLNGAFSKVYDGTTSALLSAGQVGLSGFAAGEGASVAALAGQFNNANVASANTVSASLPGNAIVAGAGTALSNYILPTSVSGTAAVTPRQVSVTGVVAASRQYDGTTAATLSNAGVLEGVLAGESLSLLAPSSVQFNSSGAGTAKTVTASGYRIGDGSGLASNYALSNSTVTTFAGISQAPLTVRADDQARLLGAANPVLSWSVSGLRGSDTAALLQDVRTSTGADADSPAGAYAISIAGGQLADYLVSYVGGTLTVARASQQLESAISAVVNPLPVPALAGQGAGIWSVPGTAQLILPPAAPAAQDSGAQQETLVQVAPGGAVQQGPSPAAVAAAASQGVPQQQPADEMRELTIGGGSRILIRSGGVNTVGAP